MRRRARIDSNHEQIVDVLRARGFLVRSLAAVGDGMPDLLVQRPGWRGPVLVEVKDGAKKKLTPDQEKFRAEGWVFQIVRDINDAINL